MFIGLATKIIKEIIGIEIALILILILATYVLSLIKYYRERRTKALVQRIENHLTNLVQNHQTLNVKIFKGRWKNITILFPIWLAFDKKYAANPAWQPVSAVLLNEVILTLARKRARSRRWIMRYFACETFGFVAEKRDEKLIERLARDKVPLVYLHAITAAIKCGSETAINIMIDRIAKMSWVTKSIYLEQFRGADVEIRTFIEKRLEDSPQSEIKATCYNILVEFPPSEHYVNVESDIHSINFELRLAAIKYITHANKTVSIPILLKTIKDNEWEVRLVTINRLAMLGVKEAIPSIADCLNDSEWSVKFSAAEALKKLGPEGQALLKARAPELDLVRYDTTNYIPHRMW